MNIMADYIYSNVKLDVRIDKFMVYVPLQQCTDIFFNCLPIN